MKGLDGRPEPQSGAARKAGGILARSKWQGEGFGDVTVTPREALDHHPHGPSVAGMARPGPRLSKLQGFPISASGSPPPQASNRVYPQLSSCKEDCLGVWGSGVGWV